MGGHNCGNRSLSSEHADPADVAGPVTLVKNVENTPSV